MGRQRKPRDIDNYVTPEEAAALLRIWAKYIERKSGLISINAKFRFYDPNAADTNERGE